jgi:hypothetical protein
MRLGMVKGMPGMPDIVPPENIAPGPSVAAAGVAAVAGAGAAVDTR